MIGVEKTRKKPCEGSAELQCLSQEREEERKKTKKKKWEEPAAGGLGQ